MHWERLQEKGSYEQARDWKKQANDLQLEALELKFLFGSGKRSSTKTRQKSTRQKSTRQKSTRQKSMRQKLTRQTSSVSSRQNSLNINSADSNSEYGKSNDESNDGSDDESLVILSMDSLSDDESGPDDKDSTSRWSRCPSNHKALKRDQHARLANAFKELLDTDILDAYPSGKYYCFAERVCKAYAYLWPKDDLHMKRENIAEAAVAAVYDQIHPRSDTPHSGSYNSKLLLCLLTAFYYSTGCNNIACCLGTPVRRALFYTLDSNTRTTRFSTMVNMDLLNMQGTLPRACGC